MKKTYLIGLLTGLLILTTIGLANSANLNQSQVSQLYVSIFGRASEGDGSAYWCSNQDNMVAAAVTMLNTEPAKAYFGATLNDNQAFIEFIYKNTLGKTYAEDPTGVNYWVSELVTGKSKGQVIATLINAAMDNQFRGSAAQNQFINKVTVCNYTADTIATCPDVNDLSTFVELIDGVTDDDTTVASARDLIDAESIMASNGQQDFNLVYINGIGNTQKEARETKEKIEEILKHSVNHTGSLRKTFDVTSVYNPVGWNGREWHEYDINSELLVWDLEEDLMELFLLKTAEEKYAENFQKIMFPFNDPNKEIDKDAADEVIKYFDDMTPGDNSLEASGKIEDWNMYQTKEAASWLVKRVELLYKESKKPTVVVAHSQGNLLANLAYARLVSKHGNDVKCMVRIVNVANTSQFSVNNLNFTHNGDAALFSDATELPYCVKGDQSLETLPTREHWTRITPYCKGECTFYMGATVPFGVPPDYPSISIPDQDVVDNCLNHSIVTTYLSTTSVPRRSFDTSGVAFTPGKEWFRDRFEDFIYAAANSFDDTSCEPVCTIYVDAAAAGTGTGMSPQDAMTSIYEAIKKSNEDELVDCEVKISVKPGTYEIPKEGWQIEVKNNVSIIGDSSSNADIIITGYGITNDGGTIENVTFKDVSGAIPYSYYSAGGAVININGGLVKNCTFIGCHGHSIQGGGGVTNGFFGSGGDSYFQIPGGTVENCDFIDCSAGEKGGGVSNIDGFVLNCRFTNCSVTKNNWNLYGGGGIYNGDGGTVKNCTFENCSGPVGGGIFNQGGTVYDCTIDKCKISYLQHFNKHKQWMSSAGIYNQSGTITDCTVSNCEGGGILGPSINCIEFGNKCWQEIYNTRELELVPCH